MTREVAFSTRLPTRTDVNAISRAVEALRARRRPFIDLTASNPTTAGFAYPADLLAPLSATRALVYDPHPLGLMSAREAVAADMARRGVRVDPETVVLSASTSESYSWLFKLLCSPGETVLAPRPSYPLFDHLTRLEGVGVIPYDLRYHGRWEIDLASLADAPASVRALLVVSPNNPTGSYLTARELERADALCRDRGWALIVDEVFADYALDEASPLTDIAQRTESLSFTLGGASKAVGLPQVKLGWIVVGGGAAARRAALEALELVADTFLSVSTPVQVAAPELLRRGADVRRRIHERVRRNLTQLRAIARDYPACEALRVEGGWCAPLRLPATRPEEVLTLALLEEQGVLVHPGYFFDFPHEAFVIVSLLVGEGAFDEGCARMLSFAST